MRITTWNVNGLRAVLGKGLLESVRLLDTDVLCLQEIKARPEQIEAQSLQNIGQIYPHLVWNPALRPGYSGTATLSKVAPLTTECGMRADEFDGEGRVIISRYPNFVLFNIYFPNGQHDLGRVPYKLNFYAHLLKLCDQLHAQGENIIICGDFNTAHQEIDLRHPKANSKYTGFLPEEREWVTKYLSQGFVDIFRKLYPERVEYTWWTYLANARQNNVGWRLDYFLVSEGLLDRVEDVFHYQQIMGSAHCPVSLVLKD
jgi:exodeoxyribonuclease III